MSSLLKQKLMLIFILATLLVTFFGFLIANDSLAWFSENKEVTADGLSVSAKVSPNLIIAKSEDGIRAEGNVLFGVDFKGTSRSDMIAVTRDESVPTTYLKYLKNHYAVDNKTGVAKPGMELEFEDVPATGNERYFIDYVVYIASAFDPLAVDSLTATITIPESVAKDYPYFHAASIDFYVGEVSEGGYRGTTAVAAIADAENGTVSKNVVLVENGTIPLNTEGHIKVIMRCYFDGALEQSEGQAYVNSYTVKTQGVVIGVEFLATESEKAEEN